MGQIEPSHQDGPPPAEPARPVRTEAEITDDREDGAARPEARFPIVGVGASAGGLSAFEAFFSGIPADTEHGMAFVLVQHLDPDHKSILSELVKRYTTMKVFEVEDGMKVQPGCAYIIPPNRNMALLNGRLQLLEASAPRGLRLPIDFFFRSLAHDQHDRAICIVLSGNGSDGTLGARAIKGEGGTVMAQTPESAEYDGMPRSVIAAGLVDYVLRPTDMAARLIAFGARAFQSVRASTPADATPPADDAMQKVFVILRAQTSHDFSQYKPKTIERRVQRRMAVHQIERLDDYARFLQETPIEVEALFSDLLIGVTQFFRDPSAFAALEAQISTRLFAGRPAGSAIRIWVVGCSTGEEAYSIGMLLEECMQTLQQRFRVQLFATDIDRRAIDVARAGVYPASIAADVSADRLARFFVQMPSGDGYRVSKSIRDMLVFSLQNAIKDPPFSRLDLISCRNLLIYLDSGLHKKLIPLFHYVLNPGGLLYLGTSETVGEFASLFGTLDRKAKVYQRKEDGLGAYRLPLGPELPQVTANRTAPRLSRVTRGENAVRLRELTERALLQQDTHAGALITGRGDILYLHGRTGRYLELAPGEAGMNILKMAREGLRHHLAMAFHQAVAQRTSIRRPGLQVKSNGDIVTVNITVRPVEPSDESPDDPKMFVVILQEASVVGDVLPERLAVEGGGATSALSTADATAQIATLRRELRAKEEYAQATHEELETTNEELMSSNEEMQSINAELQSANEEMETSKEELQSLNEELATINAELQTKVVDLSRANNDMNNLLASTGVGMVFVDHQLRIQRFTPAITQIINLIATDVGRPVGHIVSNLAGYDTLVSDIQAVLDTLAPREIEVQTRAGAWFLLRIRPYRTMDNVIEGAVISFTNVTEMKRVQSMLHDSEGLRRLAVVVRDAYDAVVVHDLHGQILAWNPAAARIYGWSEAEAFRMSILELVPAGSREHTLATLQQLRRGDIVAPYRGQRSTKDGRIVEVWITATALVNDSGEPYAVTTTEQRTGGPPV